MDLCALCGDVIRPQDDALITPDFLADDTDPLWRFTDAPDAPRVFPRVGSAEGVYRAVQPAGARLGGPGWLAPAADE